MNRFGLLFSLLLMVLLEGNAGSDVNATDRLYIANRLCLITGTDRQITYDRHIQSIEPNPAGTRIAFVTNDDQSDGNYTSTVDTIGLEEFQIRNYLTSNSTPLSSDNYDLRGWSPDSRYFAVSDFAVTGTENATGDLDHNSQLIVCDLSTGRSSSAVQGVIGSPDIYSSTWNGSDQLLFSSEANDHFYVNVYNALANKSASWPVTVSAIWGLHWDQSGQIAFQDGSTHMWFLLDPAKGLVTPKTSKTHYVRDWDLGSIQDKIALPNSNVNLGLNVQAVPTAEVDENNSGQHPNAVGIWVGVSGLPTLPKVRPTIGYLLVDNFLYDGQHPVFVPHPNQPGLIRIATIAHGDIYLASVGFDGATVEEAYEAGEKLTCPELTQLALQDSKELGLGIIQYVQDYDERLPMADGFEDEVYPYIKDNSLFSVNDSAFNYELDGDKIGDFESPANTEVGYYLLPCAKVVVYLDGHVKSYPMTETGGRESNRREETVTPNVCPVCGA